MKKYILRINKDIEYSLLLYDDTFDYSKFNLVVEGESSDKLFKDLEEITLLQIINSETGELIKSTTKYSTIEGTSRVPKNTYLTEEGKDIPAIKVTLKEADIIPRLNKIESDLYTSIDVDTMSLEEYKEYKKSLVSDACINKIYAGIDFNTGSEEEHFTYYPEDQTNFNDMNNQIEAGFDIIPYHSARERNSITSPCKIYPVSVVRGIYVAQVMNKFIQTTKCNHIYQWIDGLDNKTAIEPITFDSELPEPYLTSFNKLIAKVEETMEAKDMTKTISESIIMQVTKMLNGYTEELNNKLENLKNTISDEVYARVMAEIEHEVEVKAELKVNAYLHDGKENIATEVKTSIMEDIDDTVKAKAETSVANAIESSNIKETVSSEVTTTVMNTIQSKLDEVDEAINRVNEAINSLPTQDTNEENNTTM